MAMDLIPAAAAAVTATGVVGNWLNTKYNISSDIAQIRCIKKNKAYYNKLCKLHGDSDWSFYHTIHCTYGQNEYDEAFLFEDRSWTYSGFRVEIGRLALEFQRLGIKNRTVVAMYINNSPEFIFAWWALYKIGAIPAPINTSITQEPFRHCIRISDAEFIIGSSELFGVLTQSIPLDSPDAPATGPGTTWSHSRAPCLKSVILYDYGTYPLAASYDELQSNVNLIIQDRLPPATQAMASWDPETRPRVSQDDTSQYLFTSGTTGLPKAAVWPAAYSMMGGGPERWPLMFKKRRRFYLCTPMFHGGAAFAVLPATHVTGGTVVLARKFSVRNFWHDIRRTRADGIFYIGEMIRYLVQSPPDPHYPDEKKAHGLEIIYGIGLAGPVWRTFRERFGVRWIAEYYGASEGTIAICNSNHSNDEGVGKVAHWGPLMRSSWFGQEMFYIIKIDLETGEVIRNPKTGLCMQAGFGEIGEAVNRLSPPLLRRHDYVGQGGAEASEKKTLRNVFQKGDMFFRMGDALSMDRDGYVTFHDRLGDTYRVKGHNISTAEVEMAIMEHPQIASANVYAIPMTQSGYDGQLGCAAITFKAGNPPDGPHATEVEALEELEQFMIKKVGLPAYGVPRFIRVLVDVGEEKASERAQLGIDDGVGSEHVSLMMKKLKTTLRQEGFVPPADSKDRMYWVKKEGQGFVPLEYTTQQQLLNGKARL